MNQQRSHGDELKRNTIDLLKSEMEPNNRVSNHSMKSLSNEELLSHTKLAAQNEKEATLRLLDYLAEVEARRLYSLRAYTSLWEFVVKELHYSESQASERIHAMRLLKKVPEVKKHIEEGELSMTTAAQINRFLHQESKSSPMKWQPEKTSKLIALCKHKSKREVEAVLVAESNCPVEKPKDKERLLSTELRELKFVVSKEVSDLLEELRAVKPISLSKVFEAGLKRLLSEAKEKNTVRMRRRTEGSRSAQAVTIPNAKTKVDASASTGIINGAQNTGPTQNPENETTYSGTNEPFPLNSPFPATVKEPELCAANEKAQPARSHSRYIPKAIRQSVWQRAAGRCEYKDQLSQRRCESRYRLEFEHCQPFATGGQTHADNMRVLCREHNRLMAIHYYGPKKMESYIRV